MVIPCIYDNMKVFDDVCHAEIKYKKCYFNMDGTPIFGDRINGIRKTAIFMGWEYVEDFEGKAISIGKKDGKYGILRVDGSCFCCLNMIVFILIGRTNVFQEDKVIRLHKYCFLSRRSAGIQYLKTILFAEENAIFMYCKRATNMLRLTTIMKL